MNGIEKRFSSLICGDQLMVEPKAKSATPWFSRRNSLVCLPAKSWPAEAFVALVRELSPDRPWLLILGPAEGEGPPALLRVSGAVPARELPPRALAALVARAGLYVGNDSGVSHLAAAAGAQTLVLFGPTDPLVWAPLGPKVAVVRSADRRITGLSLNAVVEAAEGLRTR